MKRFFGIFLVSLFVCTTGFAQTDDTAATPPTDDAATDLPIMTYETPTVDYGVIEAKSEPLRTFHFTNTGNAPLIISDAKGSCGCTVPKKPDYPILPGESDVIEVRYATNRIGKFSKKVTLTTNDAVGKHVLTIKGEVLSPSEAPAATSPAAPADNATPTDN